MNKIYEDLLRPVIFPKMYTYKQEFEGGKIDDIKKCIEREVSSFPDIDLLKGRTVAVGVGSRGIKDIVLIVKALIENLRKFGADVYIVPAMGSHGGAIAENQTKILEHLGITEAAMGCKILSSMETKVIGHTDDGVPVHMDRNACSADYTVTVARIKPHSSFRGKFESGMLKMCVIGLGKQHGADFCHEQGMANMGKNLEKIGRVFIENSNLLFSLGLIENAYDETCFIKAVAARDIMNIEPALLERSKSMLPSIPFKDIDMLVVDEFGKNITGTGMDCNIIKRFTSEHMTAQPITKRLVVLNLTDESDGNASGFGLADISTRKAFEKMDMLKTYPNLMTSRTVNGGKIPLIMDDDYDALRCGIKTAPDVDYNNMRIVHIKNTLSLGVIEISEALVDEAKQNCRLTPYGEGHLWQFDSGRDLISIWGSNE